MFSLISKLLHLQCFLPEICSQPSTSPHNLLLVQLSGQMFFLLCSGPLPELLLLNADSDLTLLGQGMRSWISIFFLCFFLTKNIESLCSATQKYKQQQQYKQVASNYIHQLQSMFWRRIKLCVINFGGSQSRVIKMLIEVFLLRLGLGELAYGNKIIKSCSWNKKFNMKEQLS